MEVSGKLYGDVVCELCEPCQVEGSSTKADGVCNGCNEYMCQTCFRHHLKSKSSRNHVLDPLSQGKAATKPEGNARENCQKHSQEVLKYYCRQHDKVTCGDCNVFEHQGCKIELIRSLARNFQESSECKQMLKRIKRIQLENEGNRNQLKNNRTEHMLNMQKLLDEIRRFRKDLNDYLDHTETQLVVHVKKLTKENEDLMSELEEKITNISRDIAELKSTIDESLYQGDILFIRLVECKPKCNEIENFVAEVKRRNDTKSMIFEPDHHLKEIISAQLQFGCLKTATRDKQENRPKTEKCRQDEQPYEPNDGNNFTSAGERNKPEPAKTSTTFPQQSYFPSDPTSEGFGVEEQVRLARYYQNLPESLSEDFMQNLPPRRKNREEKENK